MTAVEDARARLKDDWNSNAWDSATNPFGMADGGHAQKSTVDTSKANWDQHMADLVLVSEETALIKVGANFTGTSTTSLLIETGSKTFTIVETDRAWAVGSLLRAADVADSTNFMVGNVTAYSGTTLTVNVTSKGGSGTLANWSIGLEGAVGPTGFNSTLIKTADYTTVVGDDGKVILGDATAGAFTVTLLAAATAGNGHVLTIKKTDASVNAVTVDANAAETIDGALTFVLSAQYQILTIICDGSNWHVIFPAGVLRTE